jgi:glucosylglycerate synthase
MQSATMTSEKDDKPVSERQTSNVDLLIVVPAPLDSDEQRFRAFDAVRNMNLFGGSLQVAVASPVAGLSEAKLIEQGASDIRFLGYPLVNTAAASALPWLPGPAAYREIAQLAATTQAQACMIVSDDLGIFDGPTIEALARPVLEKQSTLSVPIYASGKYEGLLNDGILYPFVRSLYGRQVRNPVAADFAVAGSAIAQLAPGARPNQVTNISCPIVDAVSSRISPAQVYVPITPTRHEGVDLSTVLAALLGSIFEGVERNAALWQRIRGSESTPLHGQKTQTGREAEKVDPQPLIDSFNLGWRNLQEVWNIILPPTTLFALKGMSRQAAPAFKMPDAVWARIVFDFALAYRLRSISRTHLLGALTPLYLGWVASYVNEVESATLESAALVIERLAAAFEEEKTYLISRWRWPDRFNP